MLQTSKAIDITNYPVKNQLQLIRGNLELMISFNTMATFEDFKAELDKEAICSPETIEKLKDMKVYGKQHQRFEDTLPDALLSELDKPLADQK